MNDTTKLYDELVELLDLKTFRQMKKLETILEKYNVESNKSKQKLSKYIKQFLEYKKSTGVAKGTISYYKDHLDDFLKFYGDKDPTSISKQDITEYLLHLQSIESFGQNTRFQYVGVLRNFMNYLESEKIISRNYMRSIKYKQQKNTRYPLTIEEIDQVRNTKLDLLERLVFEFLLCTGCRIGEVSNITLKDINFNENTCKVTGKGNKTRTVIFNDQVKKLLKQYKKQCTDNKHLICIPSRGKIIPITKSKINATLKQIQKKAKLKDSLYCHKMRHTFASLSLEKGMDLISIQTLMGHENLVTTQVYAKQNLGSIKNEYRRIFEDE